MTRPAPCRAGSRRAGSSRGSPAATVPATVVVRPSPRRRRVSWAANAPASGVLRSMTVIPRALARAPALTRLTRSVVGVSSRPRSTAAVSGDASCSASSPAISSVSVRTPPRQNWAKNRPRTSASGRYGAIARAVSGREQRGVDRVAGAPSVEHVEHLARDLLGDERPGPRPSMHRGAASAACSGHRAAASRSAARARRRRSRRRRAGRRGAPRRPRPRRRPRRAPR